MMQNQLVEVITSVPKYTKQKRTTVGVLTIDVADVFDVGHHYSHESVQPLSHRVSHHSNPAGFMC